MQIKHAGRKLALTVLVLLALAVFLTAGTMALFTDAQGVPGNGFTTGTHDRADERSGDARQHGSR